MVEAEDERVAYFRQRLLDWWRENRRMFPWRTTTDPYRILVTEVLLHRTKAEQVATIYHEFFTRFPTIEDLAAAPLEDVKRLLHCLGLHWRTELLHRMAVIIVEKYGAKIPSERDELMSLPGVSHYIASAVRCFAFGFPEGVLDTNTVRIVGRFFGLRVTDSSRRSRRFRELYESLLDKDHPREFNYAMIDLGALLCTSRNPRHNICPLAEKCIYAATHIRREKNERKISRRACKRSSGAPERSS
jgi:A/G-specific DNA glycosylase